MYPYLESFLEDLAARKSRHTVETYRGALVRFEPIAPADPAALGADHVLAYARALSDADPALSVSTKNTYLVAVHILYRYLIRERMIHLDAADLERIRAILEDYRQKQKRLPKATDAETLARLLQAARKVEDAKTPGDRERANLRSMRDTAILLALWSSGVRVGELVRMRRGDLDTRTRQARVIGKRDKERVVYFAENAVTAIRAYLAARKDGTSQRLMADLPLFARHDRGAGKKLVPLTTHRVEQIFVDLCKRAELEVFVTPHGFRHSFATIVLEATGSIAYVQRLLGHESPATTGIYAQVTDKQTRAAHRAAFGE